MYALKTLWEQSFGSLEERDEDFYKFVKDTLGTDLYSSIQMNGEGFDQEWAVKSVKLLCYQKRKGLLWE